MSETEPQPRPVLDPAGLHLLARRGVLARTLFLYPFFASGVGEAAVEVEHLTKSYRTTFSVRRNVKVMTGREPPVENVALKDLSFSVKRGEVYGVLGPNGAGKTTLMKVLATILLPNEGTLRVLGHDVEEEPDKVRPKLGVVLGEYERTFHWRLTGRQNLLFFAEFFNLPRDVARRRADELLALVDLAHKKDKLFLEYSTGEKHRLALARGLMNEPGLLILDEPTAGLDAQASESIARLVREIAANGTTVCYTTHRLLEAGRLCDRILILKAGEKIAEATPDELIRLSKEKAALEFSLESAPADLADRIRKLEGVHDAKMRGRILRVYVDDVNANVDRLAVALKGWGLKVNAVNTHMPTVEDVFMELVGNRAETHAEAPLAGRAA